MKRAPDSPSLLTIGTLVALFALPGFAANDRHENVGHMNASSSLVEWQVGVDNDRILLTVTGPGRFVYAKEFPAGKNPSFRVHDNPAKNVDGVYSYELRVVPRISSDVRKRLAEARAAGNDAEIARIQDDAGLTDTIVQSGAFTVVNGSFISSDLIEPSSRPAPSVHATADGSSAGGVRTSSAPIRALDQVIPDDLIVQGSACVGLDCVNNESFGFDTLRLKENNTRIKFDDTSVAAGFPANDWQLTANDSASGGQNKFSIEDVTAAKVPFTVLANAPTASTFISSNGKVGYRTSTPVLDLHVTTSDTPAHRFEQTSAGGFTAQTWDIGANEANFFVRDVTGGSRLPFRIRPGAPTSSIDISASGNVGVGTASPQRKLHLIGPSGSVVTFPTAQIGPQDVALFENNSNINVTLIGGVGSTSTLRFTSDGAATFGLVRYLNASNDLILGTAAVERLRINSAGQIGIGVAPTQPIEHSNGAFLSGGGAWTNASSRAYKQNICNLDSDEARRTLEGLTPVTYAYKLDPDEHHVGFIAEDAPDIVASKDHKGMSAMDVAAVLTKVVKEQQRTIEELTRRIEQLEKKN